jgi:tetratricopeptide (TPR) repeat protein
VLRYQCSPYHVHSALYPVVEQLEHAAGFNREDTPQQKLDKLHGVLAGTAWEVAQLAPLFARLLSLPLETPSLQQVSAQKQKEMLLEALAGQVEALAGRQAVLMIYEDIHWIDATTEEALDLLLPRLQRLPVLLIATHRPGHAVKWSGQAHVTLLGLSRLGRREATDLIANVTGGKALPVEVLEQIIAHTDGVPLFVEELTRSILESRLLHDAGNHYALDGPMLPLAIPTTLRDSLLARLDRLASVREIAQIGACIGREFSYELLAAVAPLQGDQLDEALEQITQAELLFRRGIPPDAFYTFKHALVQDVAYDSLLKSKRTQLHARIAQALKTNYPDLVATEPELLARHYTEAGQLSAAIPLWRKAGELAWSRVAMREAAAHLTKGLALVEQLGPSPERHALELSIREPLHAVWVALRGWAAPEVAANALALLEVAKAQGEPNSALMGLWGMWVITHDQGRSAESLMWARQLLDTSERPGSEHLRTFGHFAGMASHFYCGELLEAREHGARLLDAYDPQHAARIMQLTGHDAKTVADGWRAHWTWMLGYPDEAVKVIEGNIAHARSVGNPFNLGWALTVGAQAFDYRAEPQKLLEHVHEADRLSREQRIPFLYEVLVPLREGLAKLTAGELAESVTLLREGIHRWVHLGGQSSVPYMKTALAKALALQGNLSSAHELVEESLKQMDRVGWQERVWLAEALRTKGWLLMREGRGDEAESALRASLDWARHQQAKSWELRTSTTLAQLLSERGEVNSARDLLVTIHGWFTEGFDTQDLKVAKALIDRLS